MTSINRGRWDFSANPKSIKEYPIASADAIETGDLMWWDTKTLGVRVARPFSHANAWTGSLAGSQAAVAEVFLGVAMSAHAANDTVITTVRIAGRGVFSYPLGTNATFEVGDLITASQDTGGASLLDDQRVEKGAVTVLNEPTIVARSLAIGKATKRYPVATPVVDFEILGIKEAGGSPRAYLTS